MLKSDLANSKKTKTRIKHFGIFLQNALSPTTFPGFFVSFLKAFESRVVLVKRSAGKKVGISTRLIHKFCLLKFFVKNHQGSRFKN